MLTLFGAKLQETAPNCTDASRHIHQGIRALNGQAVTRFLSSSPQGKLHKNLCLPRLQISVYNTEHYVYAGNEVVHPGK